MDDVIHETISEDDHRTTKGNVDNLPQLPEVCKIAATEDQEETETAPCCEHAYAEVRELTHAFQMVTAAQDLLSATS